MPKCNECAGLRMQVGRLKKKVEEGERIEIPDLIPYVSKIDVLKNLVDQGDLEAVKKELYKELANFKGIFKQLIRDVAASDGRG
jgi:hypothetical protein